MNSSTHSLPLSSAYLAHASLSKDITSASPGGSPRSSLTSRQPAIELTSFGPSLSSTTTDLPTPTTANAILMPTKRLALYRAALYWLMFVEGWNDSTAGPLIPVIRKTYGLNFTIVSMLFVASAIGFGMGALLNIYLTDRYGLGKVWVRVCSASETALIMTFGFRSLLHVSSGLVEQPCVVGDLTLLVRLGAVIQMVAYCLIGAAVPFPAMCFGYGLCGLTMAVSDGSQCEVCVSHI